MSVFAIHRTLVLHMLQNKSLAVLKTTILGSRLYKLNNSDSTI